MTPTPVEEAKSLMDLVGTPSALVTGTFLAFVGRALKENIERTDRVRMRFALLAAVGAVGIMGSLAWLLLPFGIDHGLEYEGHFEPAFLVFWMITLSAVGTAAYSAHLAYRCVRQLQRPTT